MPSMACFMAMLIFQNIYAIYVTMAGILHNVFSKGMYTLKDPENVSKFKTLVNHSGLYFGLIVYTTIGAKVMRIKLFEKDSPKNWIFKVFQMLELPAELDEKETYLDLLENERKIFLETIFNSTNEGFTDDYKVVSALNSYEAACSDAADVGVNIVEKVCWILSSVNRQQCSAIAFPFRVLT